jgi:15-cis-phytoene synthase
MPRRPLRGELSEEASCSSPTSRVADAGTSGSTRADQARRDPASVLAASTFSAGLLLLPRSLQQDARSLYYLLRTLDDLVDEDDPRASERVEAVEQWARGECALDTAEVCTLKDLSRRYPLSRQAFADFCKGMRADLTSEAMKTEADLERYCEYVAGTVAIMLAGLLGTTHPDGVTKMAVLGRAMQRTNILRDIDEDLARGRVYIASSTIERFGFPYPGKREELLREQIGRADALFAEGLTAIPLLREGRRAMGISGVLYREILRQIEREGFGRRAGRAKVPTWRKQLLIARYPPQ